MSSNDNELRYSHIFFHFTFLIIAVINIMTAIYKLHSYPHDIFANSKKFK